MSEETPQIVYDVNGDALTVEEAMKQEEELLKQAEFYFASNQNPGIVPLAEEEDDDENHTVSLDNDGKIIDQTIERTVERDVLVEPPAAPARPSFIEQTILRKVIQQRLETIKKAYQSIIKTERHWYELSNGSSAFDNFTDTYRNERGEYIELLNKKEIVLEDIENERIKAAIKKEVETLVAHMLDFSNTHDTYTSLLKELTEDDNPSLD